MSDTTYRYSAPTRVWLLRIAFCGLAGMAGCATASGSDPAPVVRRDPVEQFEVMLRVTTQIDRKTRDVPDVPYASVTRPRMIKDMRAMGFSDLDAAEVMSRVDKARADRAQAAPFMGRDSQPVGNTALRTSSAP